MNFLPHSSHSNGLAPGRNDQGYKFSLFSLSCLPLSLLCPIFLPLSLYSLLKLLLPLFPLFLPLSASLSGVLTHMGEEVSFEVTFTLKGDTTDWTSDDGPCFLMAEKVVTHCLPSVGHIATLGNGKGREGDTVIEVNLGYS